jgi:hypothetical protein
MATSTPAQGWSTHGSAAAFSVTFHFEGHTDYNFVNPKWEGPFPDLGSIVVYHPRTTRWRVREHRWTVAVDRAEATLARSVTVVLAEVDDEPQG